MQHQISIFAANRQLLGNILAEFSSTGLSQEDLPKALRPSLDAFQNAIRGIRLLTPSTETSLTILLSNWTTPQPDVRHIPDSLTGYSAARGQR